MTPTTLATVGLGGLSIGSNVSGDDDEHCEEALMRKYIKCRSN
jgi:hypothetical protein